MYMPVEYENASLLHFNDVSDMLEEFTDEISEMQGRCIDIGCGPGNITKLLILPKLPSQAELEGTDISKSMIEHAKQKYGGEKRLSFYQLDIETSNLPREVVDQYDNALSFYCLHWVQDSRQAFGNIYKLLRAGGKALVMLISSRVCFDAYVRMHEDPRFRPYMQDVDRFISPFQRSKNSRAELRNILKDLGFEVLHCSKREKSFIFQNIEILRNQTLAVNPFILRIPEHLKAEYEDALTQEMIKGMIVLPKDSDGNQCILDRYQILVAYVKKPAAAQ